MTDFDNKGNFSLLYLGTTTMLGNTAFADYIGVGFGSMFFYR